MLIHSSREWSMLYRLYKSNNLRSLSNYTDIKSSGLEMPFILPIMQKIKSAEHAIGLMKCSPKQKL